MDVKSALVGAVGSTLVAAGAVFGLNLTSKPAGDTYILAADATATAIAAPVPGVGCPPGWVPAFGGWQPREDGRSYIACDFKGQWNLAIVNDGSKVLTRYKGGDVEQYIQLPDGTGDNVDARVEELR
jgi:hypothetical protein